jgi:hypothetical protein
MLTAVQGEALALCTGTARNQARIAQPIAAE